MGDYPIQYCDTDTVRLCQYNTFLVIKAQLPDKRLHMLSSHIMMTACAVAYRATCDQSLNLSACELPMFKLYLN